MHCVEEVCGEDRETFVEISRLVLEFSVFLDVIGKAKLAVGVRQCREPNERYENTAEDPHLVYLKTANEELLKLCRHKLMAGNSQ